MDKTVLIAVLTLVITPILVAVCQNIILRLGKKDDMTLAREQLIFQREEAIEKKRDKLQADLEEELAAAQAQCEQLREQLKQWQEGRGPAGPRFLLPTPERNEDEGMD